MLQPSHTGLDIDVAALPLLHGAAETIGAGIVSSLHATNLERREMITNYEAAVHDPRVALLFDPQTAGGLIAGVPEDQAEACLQGLRALGYSDCAAIGTVRTGDEIEKPITLGR
jgi:selenide,water dikinase